MWRWDQGRLLYFQYDVLREIAKVLVKFDQMDISKCEGLFRRTLQEQTGMPFYPESYTIKRNYSRVFQCAFLASFLGNKLSVTDFCRDIAEENGRIRNVDDFLLNYISRFRYPFPAFDHYNVVEKRVYPFCAIIKYLFAQKEMGQEEKMSLDDVFNIIISNNCTGMEEINFYKNLKKKDCSFGDVEKRQLREMVIYISQLSFLKVYKGCLYLDSIEENVKADLVKKFLSPKERMPKENRFEEFGEMTSLENGFYVPKFENLFIQSDEIRFFEGNRKRVEHFRIERSGLLRKYYKENNPIPICCACGINIKKRYPWTEYMLDIHHLLPLSSSISITSRGTSLNDIVGLCPTCHRAIHSYYRKWLTDNQKEDFESKKEAHEVYMQAIKEIA